MSVSEEERQRSKNFIIRQSLLLGIIVTSIVIVIFVLWLMTPSIDEGCGYPARIDLEYAGPDDGWYNLTVVKTCTYEEVDSEILLLSGIGLLVFTDNATISFLEDGEEVTWITLSDARENGLDPSYDGSVVYYDADGDGFVSEGDSLLVKSLASGGPLGEERYIGLETDDGHLGVGAYECCS